MKKVVCSYWNVVKILWLATKKFLKENLIESLSWRQKKKEVRAEPNGG